ncbi:DUF2163 domain-containing protein [Pelosinus propionicus]|uniref:Bacteriophage phiJL001 Gp84 C-terminal domain-containing protein n=1 Tax=Pelosinus propionicus DSM 13327 TaxID=1123291 RepID=A0A1I4N0Z2_9FIRM|nr:DUF2163 domain-containing protein [Pelosinus propionicus]SFM09045.1 phage conserved hypothetical protein BR0599 [Pelosinus propionicus DSM 13327]
MKECSDVLKNYLHSTTSYLKCDLYEITLQGGIVLRYADYDMDIKLTDGRLFKSTGPIFVRGQTKQTAKIEVDSMDVSVLADANDIIGSATWMEAAQTGAFDNADLVLYKCYMYSPGVVVDILEWFGGYVDVEGGGGIEMEWKIKSDMQKLNIDYPTRKYYPTCPYSLYGPGCELNIADYTTSGTITQVVNKQEIHTSLAFGDGYFDLGGVVFTSGNLIGSDMSVKKSYSAGGRIIFIVSLDSLPSVGDTFTIYPGCAKTPAVCATKFGNFSRNRSTPYIPLKETIT